jgi:hypothetical protein
MTPQLLNYLRADSAFRQIALFADPDGKATYLFERAGDATRSPSWFAPAPRRLASANRGTMGLLWLG